MTPAGSRLTALEVACGLVFGVEAAAETQAAEPARSPREALEQAILPALRRPPCVVSFSGGRDSSAVLAVATHLARREGLPLPVPVTNRFQDAPRAAEAEWQEQVVAHLGLSDWERLEFHDELDAVGPLATEVLQRHGLLWPFNVYFHAPILATAGAGTLLTGIGGDEVFSRGRWARAGDVLAGRVRPVRRDVLRLGLALSPTGLKRSWLRRRADVAPPWLRPDAAREVERAWSSEAASEPRGTAARLRWWRRLRSTTLGLESLDRIAAETGAHVVHPFAEPSFGVALSRTRPAAAGRAQAMRAACGDVLPVPVYERTSKAVFDEAFWGRHCRALASQWTGEGADDRIVDADALRAAWAAPIADPRSLSLVQAAWLAASPGEPSRRDASLRSRPTATHAGGEGSSPVAPQA